MKITPVPSEDPFDLGAPDPNKFEVQIATRRPRQKRHPALSPSGLCRIHGASADNSFLASGSGFTHVQDENSLYFRDALQKLDRWLQSIRSGKRPPKLKWKLRKIYDGTFILTVENSGPGRIFYYLDLAISAYNPDIIRSPVLEEFYAVIKSDGYMDDSGGFTAKSSYSSTYPSKEVIEDFDNMLANLYEAIRSPRIASLIKARNRRARDELKSNTEYVGLKIAQFPKMTAVMIELAYLKEDSEALWSTRTPAGSNRDPLITVVQQDARRFFNNVRSRSLSDNVEGYIRWIDFGAQRGPFVKILLLLLDVDKATVDDILRESSEVWGDVTDGRGVVIRTQNCFASETLNKVGGVVTHDNPEAVAGLYLELQIQAAISLHFIPNFGRRFERFSRSEFPGAKAEQAARVRREVFTLEVREEEPKKKRRSLVDDGSIVDFLKIASKVKAVQELRDNAFERLRRRSLKRKNKSRKKATPSSENSMGMNTSSIRSFLATFSTRKAIKQVEPEIPPIGHHGGNDGATASVLVVREAVGEGVDVALGATQGGAAQGVCCDAPIRAVGATSNTGNCRKKHMNVEVFLRHARIVVRGVADD